MMAVLLAHLIVLALSLRLALAMVKYAPAEKF